MKTTVFRARGNPKEGPTPLPQWRRRFAKCRKFSAPSSPNLVRAKSCAAIARACEAEIAEMILKLGDPDAARATTETAIAETSGGPMGYGSLALTRNMRA